MDNRIGTCSLCGGPVVMPAMMVNPVPCCQHCGAHPKHPHGPVIEMEPRKKTLERDGQETMTAEWTPRR